MFSAEYSRKQECGGQKANLEVLVTGLGASCWAVEILVMAGLCKRVHLKSAWEE